MNEHENILLVEDETLIREGLKALLKTEPFVGNILEAGNKRQVDEIQLTGIHLAIVDFRLGNTNSLELIPKLKEHLIKIIMVTGLEGSEIIINLLRAGVHSIVYKLDGYREIRNAILCARKDDTYFPPTILKIIQTNANDWDRVPPVTLTFGENELLTAIASGLTTKEIAVKLKMTEATTETYRLRLIRKLGVPNTAAMIAYAFRNGIL